MRPYADPIIDRTMLDITNRTTKAFFNVADWQRIYNNAQVTKALVDFLFSINVTFDVVAEPTIATIPTVAQLNTLLANIERIRVESCLPVTLGLVAIKNDWLEGNGADSPDYLDVNEWESVLNLIYYSLGYGANYYIYCGVSQVGQARFYQSRWRHYSWVEDSATPVRRARVGVATTGTGATRNNKFRRYD